jgi:SAM-dependent methyltransferase
MRGTRRLAALIGIKMPPPVLPALPESSPGGSGYSPQLRFGTVEHEFTQLFGEHMRRRRRGRFLDVGGGSGEKSAHFAGPYEHVVLDLSPSAPNSIAADICACPEVPDESFDIVHSWNTYEHIARPWLAARETARILKPGGLATVATCFAWRYHPVPSDYWRFTHSALELLFEDAGLETVVSGYDLRFRRDDRRGGNLPGNIDGAPIDELGGFRENWAVFYAGRKPGAT